MKKTKDGERVFKIGRKVEVTCMEEGLEGSWYACTIIKKPKISKKSSSSTSLKRGHYLVEYEELLEDEYHSKPLREYVDGSLLRPLPPTPPACAGNFQIFDVVEANYRDGWWVGVVVQVKNDGSNYCVLFQTPLEEVEFRREQLRPHLSWLGGDKWTAHPKKIVKRPLLDGNKTVGSFQLETVPAEISVITTPSPATGLQLPTSDHAEGSHSLNCRNVVQALEAPSLLNRSFRLSSSEGNPSCKRKMKVIQLQSNNNANDSKSCEKKRRLGSKKEAVRRFLYSLQEGDEPGESDVMHENTTEQILTSDIAGDSQTKELILCSDPAVTEISEVWKELEALTYTDPAVTEISEVWKELEALATYTDPTSTQCSKQQPITVDVNPILDQSRTWPFTKRSGIWKTIESMEVFKSFPQMPHFSPLSEHKEDMREEIAICLMMKFAYEVERITSVSPEDLCRDNNMEDILRRLKELEPHGFSTSPLEIYLEALLKKMNKENELQEDLKEVESEIRKCQAEKAATERELSKLVERMKSLQEQLSEFQSRKDTVSTELDHIRLTKEALPMVSTSSSLCLFGDKKS